MRRAASKVKRDYEDFSPNVMTNENEVGQYLNHTVAIEQELQAREIRVRSPSRGNTIEISR